MAILINDNTARVQYTATAGQTVFIVPYEFFEVGDLKVYNGDTLLTYNVSPSSASQYSVTGAGVTGGGSITLGSPGATLGNIITILRDIPIKRVTDFPNAGPFNIEALNTELDKITAVQQNLETDLDNRVLRFSDSDTPNSISAIPNKAARQNKLLGFDVQGQPVAYDTASLATLVAYATAYADTFTGNGSNTTFTLSGDPAVIANLDVSINGVTQVPLVDYTLSGTTLTTTTAVPNGAVMLVKFKEGLPNYSGDAQDVRYTPGFTGAVQQSVEAKLEQYVSVKDFGAVGNGVTDDTAAIQAAIDAVSSVEFPAGHTFVTSGNTIGSDKTLVINGTVLLKAASPAGTKMFVNDDQVGGNTNIKILGNGVLNGNKANQTGATDTVWHTLVDIENCDYFEFAVAKITGNYFPVAVSAGNTTGAVYVRNSDYVSVHDSLATDYGREAFWCENCNESSMTNLKGVGGTDSWSVVQFSGDRNIASNIYANNAGASGASFDITNSTISNVVNYNNRFQNGVNFGHAGIPADYSTATNIVSINAAIGSSNAGIQVAAGTVGFVLDGFQVSGSAGPGIRVSDSSDNIRISNGVSTGNTGFGLVLYTAAATDLPRFYVTGVDLRGNTAGTYSRSGGTAAELFRNVRLSNDPMVGFQAINGLGAGGTVTVTNGNVVSTSIITANASNLAGANAVPLVQSVVDGSFVIQTVNSGAGGAGLRYYIS